MNRAQNVIYRAGPLTPENLTHVAPEWRGRLGAWRGDEARSFIPEDLAMIVLGPAPAHFPRLVVAFLDRARVCMAYGGYHYDLLLVGLGQLGLAAEAAIREYARANGLEVNYEKKRPQDKDRSKGMGHLIDELGRAERLSEEQCCYWRKVAELRNTLFHPEAPQIFPTGGILGALTGLTTALLQLFPLPEGAVWPPVYTDAV